MFSDRSLTSTFIEHERSPRILQGAHASRTVGLTEISLPSRKRFEPPVLEVVTIPIKVGGFELHAKVKEGRVWIGVPSTAHSWEITSRKERHFNETLDLPQGTLSIYCRNRFLTFDFHRGGMKAALSRVLLDPVFGTQHAHDGYVSFTVDGPRVLMSGRDGWKSVLSGPPFPPLPPREERWCEECGMQPCWPHD